MALSNWDLISFDPDGKVSNGLFESKNKTILEIYKNWVYIKNEKSYVGGSHCSPTIGSINHGEITIDGINIKSIRYNAQEAIFVYAEEFIYEKDEDVISNYRRFGGIGCYGYDDTEWTGIKKETLNAFFEWLEKFAEKHTSYSNKSFCEWIENCKKQKPESFNQGDAYFAEQIGVDTPKSEIGKDKPKPIFTKLLEGLK